MKHPVYHAVKISTRDVGPVMVGYCHVTFFQCSKSASCYIFICIGLLPTAKRHVLDY